MATKGSGKARKESPYAVTNADIQRRLVAQPGLLTPAQRLVELRLSLGENQAEFASRADVTRAAVSLWENGEGFPKLEAWAAIGESMGYADLGKVFAGVSIKAVLGQAKWVRRRRQERTGDKDEGA